MLQQETATLRTIFSEVLANLAFMFSDEDLASPPPGEVWFQTVIGYSGLCAGTLTFLCPQAFARLLAANLLGIDPQDEAADLKAQDAAKEFMNIVCGQLVVALHGSERAFDITIPKVQELPETPDLTLNESRSTCTLSVEGFPVQLTYEPNGAEAGAD